MKACATGAPPSGTFTTSRKLCPSSLASNDFSGLEMPATIAVMKSTPLVTMLMERIVCGCANSYWIQLLSPAFGIGSLVVFSRSPSLRIAASGLPALAVILGCSDSSGHVTRGPAVRDHGSVSVILRRRRSARWRGESVTYAHVLKGSGVRRRMSQRSREGLAAFNRCLAPHILLHSLRCREPTGRPSRSSPANPQSPLPFPVDRRGWSRI